jgi:hypothetical protein
MSEINPTKEGANIEKTSNAVSDMCIIDLNMMQN